MLWIIFTVAAYFCLVWLGLMIRRLRLAARLKKTCTRLKLRLRWARPVLASLFFGRGKIDFTVDEQIHVAVLSTPLRRCTYRLTDNALVFTRAIQRYTTVSGRTKMWRHDELQSLGRCAHHLTRQDMPAGEARVLIVHPVPYDVEDCRGSAARRVNSGDELPGGFQFNTQSHFFARLEEYAKTGDMAVWAVRKRK
ncbi:MAG: hypothetical protein IKD37_07500 [Clostridia bacterium]|nr:hypothetical protein [Clostridia bacterium]